MSDDQLELLQTIRKKLKNPNYAGDKRKLVKKLIKNLNNYEVSVIHESKIGSVIRKISSNEDDKDLASLADCFINLVKTKLSKTSETDGSKKSKVRLEKLEIQSEQSKIKSEPGLIPKIEFDESKIEKIKWWKYTNRNFLIVSRNQLLSLVLRYLL